MGAFSFFVRTMLITVAVVLLLQIQWGDRTLEDHTMNLLTQSAIVKPINETARGAVIFVRNTWSKTTKAINTNFSRALHSDNQPGSRRFSSIFDRSETAVRTAAKDVEDDVKDFDGHATMKKLREKAVTTTRNIKGHFIDETKTPTPVSNNSTVPDKDAASTSKSRIKTEPNEQGSVFDNGDE